MGSIDPALIKFYAAVATDGGGIDFSSQQTSSVVGNEIARITASERRDGIIKYVKQYVVNENAETWGPVAVYLSSLPIMAPNVEVAIALTGSKSRLSTASTLTGTATFAFGTTIFTSDDLTSEVRAGESVFNSDDDDASKSAVISSVTATTIVLETAYLGTAGSGKGIAVCPATYLQFRSPVQYDYDMESPTLAPLSPVGIWKQYRVLPACPPYSLDGFTLKIEELG
jgi:hypothetical protein